MIFIERYNRKILYLQGALKLKITMKGPKKEDSEKIKCEKNKKNVTKKLKTNHGNKVNNYFIYNNYKLNEKILFGKTLDL